MAQRLYLWMEENMSEDAAPSLLLQRQLIGSVDSIGFLITYVCGEELAKKYIRCVFCIQIYVMEGFKLRVRGGCLQCLSNIREN